MSQLLSYAGWAILPRYATSFLQNLYYRLIIRAGDPHPPPGSPRRKRDFRRIYLFVVTSYLLYTLIEAYIKICDEGDFYQLLGVLPTSDDRTIKTRFRRLAALHHPDKVGQSLNTESQKADADSFFMDLKLAQDTLLDSTKRFAYDRFGKSVVEDTKATSIRGFLYQGLLMLLPQYGVGLFVMILLNMFWFSSWGRYWRFFMFFALFTLEVCLLTHPTGTFMPSAYLPAWLSNLLRIDGFYMLPFQILSLARTASMTLNIFISQLTPPQQASASPAAGNAAITPQLQRQLMQLSQFARLNDVEAAQLLQAELAPFKGDKEQVGRLRKQMKEWVSTGSLRESPPVKETVARVRERQKAHIN